MTDQQTYTRARKRAKRKLDFFKHAIVYAVVIGFLFTINLFTDTSYLWAFWPAMGWGIALALHAASVFLRSGDSEALDRLTEQELEREKARHQN